jgi:hypothetical protein
MQNRIVVKRAQVLINSSRARLSGSQTLIYTYPVPVLSSVLYKQYLAFFSGSLIFFVTYPWKSSDMRHVMPF